MLRDDEITAVECPQGGWFGFINVMQFICCQAHSYLQLKNNLFELYLKAQEKGLIQN